MVVLISAAQDSEALQHAASGVDVSEAEAVALRSSIELVKRYPGNRDVVLRAVAQNVHWMRLHSLYVDSHLSSIVFKKAALVCLFS